MLTAPRSTTRRLQSIWLYLTQAADARIICVAVFFASAAILLAWRLFTQLEVGDPAVWDYLAQSILRGQIPYKDVVEIKSPGSAYLSAAAMGLGKLASLRDVMAVRFMHILLTCVLSVITYLVAEIYLSNRVAALIASLFPLMSDTFVSSVEGGTQPKLMMILFGMLALLLIAADRPLGAGFASMLSCLCWQPGLLFTGVAFLIFSRYLTSWRDLRAVKVLPGAAIPLSILLLYFYKVGALADLWTWTVAFNFNVYAPQGIRGPVEMLTHFGVVTLRVFKADVIWVMLAALGLLMFSVERLRSTLRSGLSSSDLFKDALVIAPVIYLAFCLINLQAGPDLIPLFPFFGIFIGWFIAQLTRLLKSSPRVGLIESLPAIALSVIFTVTIIRAVTYRMQDWTLSDQEQRLKVVTDLLGPSDKIYVHGAVEILVLMNRPNLVPYILWDRGKADYIAMMRYGGSVKAMVEEIEAEAPKLVALSRLKHAPQTIELERWVAERYEKLPVVGYDIYVRKRQ
jgi:hypothetical protein